jgi:5-methyltetrahydrofolate--homocysteine methyltransferase
MMGVRPSQVGERLAGFGLAALGINCGRSLEESYKALRELRAVTALPIWFKPNAGLPQTDPLGNTFYDTTPEAMGGQVAAWLQAGAQLVGGCCGTSVAHVQAIAQAVRSAS